MVGCVGSKLNTVQEKVVKCKLFLMTIYKAFSIKPYLAVGPVALQEPRDMPAQAGCDRVEVDLFGLLQLSQWNNPSIAFCTEGTSISGGGLEFVQRPKDPS